MSLPSVMVGELCREDGKLKLMPVKRNIPLDAFKFCDPETNDRKTRRRLMINGQTVQDRRWEHYIEEYSRRALDVYNERHGGAEFELVEPLSLGTVTENGSWHHVNFKAKPKNGDCNDSSPKLFFGEVKVNADFDEDTCCIVDPNDPGITDSCGGCDPCLDPKIYHPVDGFCVGHYPFRKTAFL